MKIYLIQKHSDEVESTVLNPGYFDKAVAEKKIAKLRSIGIAHNEWVCKRRDYVNGSKEWAECTRTYETACKAYNEGRVETANAPAKRDLLDEAMQTALTARHTAVKTLKEKFNKAHPEPERDSSWYDLQEIEVV